MENRIIKFRAWDGEKKEMIAFPNYAIGFEHEENVIAFDYDKVGDYYEMELMQFTGLVDKNGRDIYEGDIIVANCAPSGADKRSIKKRKCIIEWCELHHGWSLSIIDHVKGEKWKTSYTEYGRNGNAFEVVGNIYENQDILEFAGRQN